MIVSIEDAEAGMVLMEDVLTENGSVLLPSGKELDGTTIEILKKKNIRHVQIIQPVSATPEAPVESERAAIEEQEAQEPDPAEVSEPVEEENPEVVKPALTVFVSDDKLSATLRVEPVKEGDNNLLSDDIYGALAEAGITDGIDAKGIAEFLGKWEKLKKYYEIENIAVGVPPEPGREGDLAFEVEIVKGAKGVNYTRDCSAYWQLQEYGLSPQRVDKGTVVAQKVVASPPVPGVAVDGKPLFTEEVVKTETPLDKGISLSADGLSFVADTTGVAYCTESGTLGVHELSFDAGLDLEIRANNMEAYLIFHPPGEGGKLPSQEKVHELLGHKRVVYGIDEVAIADFLEKLLGGTWPKEPVCVARGTAPENGKNGTVEFMFNTQTSLKPKENSDGSLDYKNIDVITVVGEGDQLARVIPPTPGKPGKDLSGTELPGKDGVEAPMPIGGNTKLAPDDKNLLLASVDGNVRLVNKLVEVYEGFIVEGNVDYGTGNIQYEKSVTISGDVKSGFSVTCGGDLQVDGTIEDADITVGGVVLCKFGFVGQGKGIIEAKGDVNVGFLKNQTIRSRGNISIARESINGTVLSRKGINIYGNPLSAAGGALTAREHIEVHTVGNQTGIKTLLEVGLDYTLIEELDKTEAHKQEAIQNLKKIVETYRKYERLIKIKRKLPPKDQALYEKLRETILKYQKQIQALEKRIELIDKKMYQFDTAYIRVHHSAMPGTLMKFGERHFLVKEEIVGPKTIRLVNFEIRVI